MTNEAYAEATLTEGQAADSSARTGPIRAGFSRNRERRADQGIVRCIPRHCDWIPDRRRTHRIFDGKLLPENLDRDAAKHLDGATPSVLFRSIRYVARSLAAATALGLDSLEFRSLAYLVLRYSGPSGFRIRHRADLEEVAIGFHIIGPDRLLRFLSIACWPRASRP